jgi:hypothetical protein
MKIAKFRMATAIAVSSAALALPLTAALAGDMPAPRTEGAITYLSGGVGQNEADAIKHVAGYYPLELEFLLKASPKDEYLSGVKVRIRDANQKLVLNVTAEGPFLLANLPAGKYTVSAERNGQVEMRAVNVVHDRHQHIVFEWQST